MALEDNIQQKVFSNEREKVLINTLYTHSHIVNRLNKLFKNYNVTRQQYNVLRILRGQHPNVISINMIKDRMLDKMSDASRIVERLKIKNLIEKKLDGDDKRHSPIIINSKGLELLDTLDKVMVNFELENIKISFEEAKTFNYLMDKMRGE